jgi:hypothetical protein
MRNLTYLGWITYALIISGYIVAMAFPNASVIGYSCVVIGLFTLIVLKMVPLTHVPSLTLASFVPYVPMIVVLGICSWLLAINVKYSKNIEKGNVTDEYKTFNSINFVLLLAELIVLKMDNFAYTSSVVSFIASFQLLTVFIIQMNLEYFMTDG